MLLDVSISSKGPVNTSCPLISYEIYQLAVKTASLISASVLLSRTVITYEYGFISLAAVVAGAVVTVVTEVTVVVAEEVVVAVEVVVVVVVAEEVVVVVTCSPLPSFHTAVKEIPNPGFEPGTMNSSPGWHIVSSYFQPPKVYPSLT